MGLLHRTWISNRKFKEINFVADLNNSASSSTVIIYSNVII